jgi:hypothetical protein
VDAGDGAKAQELEAVAEPVLLDWLREESERPARASAEQKEGARTRRQKIVQLMALMQNQQAERVPAEIADAEEVAGLLLRVFKTVVGFTGKTIPAALLSRIFQGGATSTASLPKPLDVAPEWHVRNVPGSRVPPMLSAMKPGAR